MYETAKRVLHLLGSGLPNQGEEGAEGHGLGLDLLAAAKTFRQAAAHDAQTIHLFDTKSNGLEDAAKWPHHLWQFHLAKLSLLLGQRVIRWQAVDIHQGERDVQWQSLAVCEGRVPFAADGLLFQTAALCLQQPVYGVPRRRGAGSKIPSGVQALQAVTRARYWFRQAVHERAHPYQLALRKTNERCTVVHVRHTDLRGVRRAVAQAGADAGEVTRRRGDARWA